jgi:hypothetical protein
MSATFQCQEVCHVQQFNPSGEVRGMASFDSRVAAKSQKNRSGDDFTQPRNWHHKRALWRLARQSLVVRRNGSSPTSCDCRGGQNATRWAHSGTLPVPRLWQLFVENS